MLLACAGPSVKNPDKDLAGRFVLEPFSVMLETYVGCLKESEVPVETFATENRRLEFSAKLEISKKEPYEPALKEFRARVIKATDLDPKVTAAVLACSEVTQEESDRMWKRHYKAMSRVNLSLLDSDRFTATGNLYPEFEGKVLDSAGFTRMKIQMNPAILEPTSSAD